MGTYPPASPAPERSEGNKTDELLYIIKISDEVSFTSSINYSDIPPLVYITGLNNI